MNDNEKPIQAEKPALDDKKKSALLRYVAIMFAVAFLLVLFSLLGQMRNSMSTISELNQSSSSALNKAEKLQEHNLELELENQELTLQMEELEENYAELKAQLADLQQQLEDTADQNEDLHNNHDQLQQELEKLRNEMTVKSEEYAMTVHAYEQLAQLYDAIVSGETTVDAAMAKYQKIESYLGESARKTFENLSSRGE